MSFPADQLLKSMLREVAQLGSAATSAAEGSALQSMTIALQLLLARETAGENGLRRRLSRLDECLSGLDSLLESDQFFKAEVRMNRDRIGKVLREDRGPVLASGWDEVLAEVQSLVDRIGRAQTLHRNVRAAIRARVVAWERRDLYEQLQLEVRASADSEFEVLTQSAWQAYLRDRFGEPTLRVTGFSPLAGGFGKQTYLFDVEGQALEGAYVLRRDLAVTLFDNDCHRIEKEYALIKAVFEKGFPAPEAVWLDTEHRLVPGGHFIVMRRSRGEVAGSVFKAGGGRIRDGFSQALAGVLARLHALPPLESVGSLTESIHPGAWHRPLGEVVRDYLISWRELFLREPHLPSPAILSLLSWLIDNVPDLSGTPVLLHGDIGFHNFLFADGELQTVLDWEFSHVGDPAEDLAYVSNTVGGSLDWPEFIAAYRAAGGAEVGDERLLFHRIWGQVRNACAANLVSAKLHFGQIGDLKPIVLPYVYVPRFLEAAQALIESGQTDGDGKGVPLNGAPGETRTPNP